MQGILLSGGTGTRLWPITIATNKQLLPIYDKPLIYYPLATMMLGGVDEIVVVTSPMHMDSHQRLLGDGSEFGISIKYSLQIAPTGIPDAFNVARENLDDTEPTVLCLGDNFFYGPGLGQKLLANLENGKALCYAYEVQNPSEFGVVVFEEDKPVYLTEKPKEWVSNFAIPGLYLFPSDVFERVSKLVPSDRGETEIIGLLNEYLTDGLLTTRKMPRGTAWLDTGTPEGMLKASEFVSIMQSRQGLFIGSPHEVAWRLGKISRDEIIAMANKYKQSNYADLLSNIP